MIVHVAIIGTPYVAFRVWSHRKHPMDAKPWKDTYSAIIVLAVITVVAYLSGPETADYTKEVVTPFSQDLVEDHALWGRIVMVIQVIAGLLGIMGWASILQEETPDHRIFNVLILLLLANTICLIYTAHLGGMIRRMDLF